MLLFQALLLLIKSMVSKRLYYALICSYCGRDINSINQDNMSYNSSPICEDCYNGRVFSFNNDFDEEDEED